MTERETAAIFAALDACPLPNLDEIYALLDRAPTAETTVGQSLGEAERRGELNDEELWMAAMLWLIRSLRGRTLVRPLRQIVDEASLELAPETVH